MPAKSQKQYKFMKAAEKGAIKKPGLSKKETSEYTKENVGSNRFSKLKEYVNKKKKSC